MFVRAEREEKATRSSENIQLFQLLRYMVNGERDKVQSIVEKKPSLAIQQYNNMMDDYTVTFFKKISLIQYAYWVGDVHMLQDMICALPSDLIDTARDQLDHLKKNGTAGYAKNHGSQYSCKPLLDGLREYIKNHKYLSDAENSQNWCTRVGQPQLRLPVHIRQQYCRPDRSFFPAHSFYEERSLSTTKTFLSLEGQVRQWDEVLSWDPLRQKGLGFSFALCRSSERTRGLPPRMARAASVVPLKIAEDDLTALEGLLNENAAQLDKACSNLVEKSKRISKNCLIPYSSFFNPFSPQIKELEIGFEIRRLAFSPTSSADDLEQYLSKLDLALCARVIDQQGPKTGMTALHRAAMNGDEKKIKVLLCYGAHRGLRTNDGDLSYDIAKGKGVDLQSLIPWPCKK